MGIQCSKYYQTHFEKDENTYSGAVNQRTHENGHRRLELTDREKELLVSSFADLKQNLSQVGVQTFLRLFESHPEVQGFFGNLKDLRMDQLSQSKIVREHGLRIMNFLDKCIDRLQTPDKLETSVGQLGIQHISYGAPVEYIKLVGPQFVTAIKPQLSAMNKWSDETEQAWQKLFIYITNRMIQDRTKAILS